MAASSVTRASAALLVWLGFALGTGYFLRDGIARTFGPDTWWLVAGWFGLMVGLMHFLVLLILARQPRVADTPEM